MDYDKDIPGNSHLNDHIMTPTPEPTNIISIEKFFACEICGKNFLTNDAYVTHKNFIHSATTLYKCLLCDSDFSDCKEYILHQQLNHLKCDEKVLKREKFSCNLCKKFFFTQLYRVSFSKPSI